MSNPVHRCKEGQDCHNQNHLCRIILSKDLARVKEIVKGSQYFCKKCGRSACFPENLCDPSSI